MSDLNEFLTKLKAGDYVKVSDGGGRLSVDKVTRKTATQIVFVHDHYDGSQYVKRFYVDDGYERGTSSSWYRSRITEDTVTVDEITKYESVAASNKAWQERQASLKNRQQDFQQSILSKFPAVVHGKIKVDFSVSNESVAWSLKMENLSEQEIESLANSQAKEST